MEGGILGLSGKNKVLSWVAWAVWELDVGDFLGNIQQVLTWGACADHELSIVVFLGKIKHQAGELGLSKS